MNKQDVVDLLERKPFVPFRVHVKGGKYYDVLHLRAAKDIGSRFFVFLGMREGTRQAEGYDHFPYEFIERVEDFPSQPDERKRAS